MQLKSLLFSITGYGLRATGYGLRATGYGLRATGYGLAAYLGITSAQAAPIDIEQLALSVTADNFAGTTLVNAPLGVMQFDDFSAYGLTGSFNSSFDAQGYGQYSWTWKNQTGGALHNLTLISYLDAELDQDTNYFFNESAIWLNGSAAQSYEADEPGFSAGDLLPHVFAGTLDNTNAFASGWVDDVSLALGFHLALLNPDAEVELSFVVSPDGLTGWQQWDRDTGSQFRWDGQLQVRHNQGWIAQPVLPVDVPEPMPWLLMLACVGLAFNNSKGRAQ